MLTRRTTLAAGAAAALAAPAVRAATGRKLVVWHGYALPAQEAALRTLIGQFQAAHPDIAVAAELVTQAGFAAKWAAARDAGALPDVTVVDAGATVPMAQAGALNTVDDLLRDVGGSAAFAPGILDMFGRFHGQLVAVPHGVHNQLLVYRRDRLEAAGIELPVTWDDALQAAAALTHAPEYYGWIPRLGPGGGAAELLWTMTRSAGGSFYDERGTPTFDQVPVREAVDFIAALARRSGGPAASGDARPEDGIAQMVSGRASMIAAPAGLIGTAVAQAAPAARSLAAAPMPIRLRVGNLLGGISVTLPKGANPEAARLFAASLYAPRNYVPLLLAVPMTLFPVLPAAEAAFQANAVVATYPYAVRATLDGIATGSLPGMERGLNPYAGPVFASHVIEDMLQAVILNRADPAAAIGDAARKLEPLLREARAAP